MCAALLGLMLVCSTRIFPARNVGGRLLVGSERCGHPGPIDSDIQIARRRDLHFRDAFDRTDLSADGFGNLERSDAQRLRKRKERDGEIAELDLGRLLDDYLGQSCVGIAAAKKLYDASGENMFEMTIQGFPLSYVRR